MDIKRLWTLFAMVIIIVMAFSLFACTPEEQGSETSSEESESTSQSESEESSSAEESSGECEHAEFYYEDAGDGKKCKKICSACEKVISTANHSKGDPDPEENCNIRCTKCNAVTDKNKHKRGTPDPYDNCNVKCALCSAMLIEAMHPDPDEDALWILDSDYPQREYTSCSNCSSYVYRDATVNHEGLTILGPDFLWDCKKNDRATVGVETDENGMKYYNVVSKTNGPTTEITVLINDGKENLMGVGKYVAILVRCESERDVTFDFWINKAGREGAGEGTSAATCLTQTLKCDGEWRLLIFDFSDSAYIDPANGVGWVRFDINNPVVGNVIDIGFMGFFSSKREISDYYGSYLDAYMGSENCTHISDGNEVASSTDAGVLVMHCLNCNAELDPTVCEHTNLYKLFNIVAVESDGLVSFKADCGACGLKGAELRSLNGDKNKNFTAAELAALAHKQAEANLENNGGYNRYSVTLITNDASVNNMPYVKFTAKQAKECCLLLNDGLVSLDGQHLGKYIAILYRKPENTVSHAMQLLYTKNGSTTAGGYVSGMGETSNDNQWRLMILDVTDNTAVNIEDGIGWTRLDILDPRANLQIAAGDEIDIAFVSFFDSKEAAEKHYAEYLKAYIGADNCTHSYNAEWQGTGNLNEMKNVCVVCSKTVIEACTHKSDENWIKHATLPGKVQSNCAICAAVMEKDCEHVPDETKWKETGNEFEFKSTCTVCDSEVIYVCNHPSNEISFTEIEGEYHLICTFCGYDRKSKNTTGDGLELFNPNSLKDAADNFTSNVNGEYSAEILTDSAKNNMPFVRITLTANTPKETFLWLCESGEDKLETVGPCFLIIYRLSSGCPTGVEVFASVTDGFMTGDNGKKVDLVADGEWHYAIFNFSNVKGWKGAEALQQLRIDLFNTADVPAGEYFDIATAGFFYSVGSAIEQYDMIAEKYNIKTTDFYAHFDTNNCVVDGTQYAIKGSGKQSVPMTADLTGVTLQNANSLALGGWCVTPGGVKSINYRVVAGDGTKGELKKLCDGAACVQAMVDRAANANCYFDAKCVNGGNFQGRKTISLAGYEGKTVTVEIVIVNNEGNEAVIAILNNISVPAAK